MLVDEVIRYDRLDEGLAAVTDRLGLPRLELPHAKGGIRTGHYRELYGEHEREIVGRIGRAEIDHFGYSF